MQVFLEAAHLLLYNHVPPRPRDFEAERRTQVCGIVHLPRSSMRSMHTGNNQSLRSRRSVNQPSRNEGSMDGAGKKMYWSQASSGNESLATGRNR
jgi:hypothetical protein